MEVLGNLVKLGNDVTAIIADSGNAESSILFIEQPFRKIKYWKTFFDFQYFYRTLKHFKGNRPDILYIRQDYLLNTVMLIAQLFRVPYVCEINGDWSTEMQQHGYPINEIASIERMERAVFKNASAIICVDSSLAHAMTQKYRIEESKLVVIENGASLEMFRHIDTQMSRDLWCGFSHEDYLLGFVGYLAPWQGLDTLIRAMRNIVDERSNVHLAIAGEGPEGPYLKELVETLHLQEKVTFTGAIDYEKVPSFISACDLCIGPLKADRLCSPVKIFEYMASSRPFISAPIESSLRIIDAWKCGQIIQSENIQDIADKVLCLSDNLEIGNKMGANGRRAAEAYYNWDRVATEIDNLFRSLLQSKPSQHLSRLDC